MSAPLDLAEVRALAGELADDAAHTLDGNELRARLVLRAPRAARALIKACDELEAARAEIAGLRAPAGQAPLALAAEAPTPKTAEAPNVSDEDRIYPCATCGVMRSKAEGGCVFTICDACWDKCHGSPDAAGKDVP